MKHDWEQFWEKKGAARFIEAEKRRCRNCGAKQRKVVDTNWMRIVRRYWRPLVGRCQGRKAS